MSRFHVLAFLAALLPELWANAEDWTEFRGADGAASAEAKPPVKWSATESIRWTRELPGPGASSPIVLKDRVYVTCYSGYGVPDGPRGAVSELKRHLVAVDRKTGGIVWDKAVPSESPEDEYTGFITEHGYASSTPATDGERIYVFYGKTGVLAFDLNGEQLWKSNVGKESSAMRWGSAASPVLTDKFVLVNAGDESLSIRALEKATGKEAWKSEGANLEASYGTPIVADVGDGRKDIVISGRDEAWGLNPDNGKLRWYAEYRRQGAAGPTAVVADGVGYLFGGRGSPAVALKLGGKGDITQSNRVWTTQANSYVPTPVLFDGKLFWVTDRGVAYCVDAATGKTLMEHRLGIDLKGRPIYASPVCAGGNIYQVTDRGGTVVFAAKPEYELVAHNQIEGDDTDFNGTPAIVDDELFLRSNKALYCIGEPRAK
jgi:outer membrane protein assembly factor BamB